MPWPDRAAGPMSCACAHSRAMMSGRQVTWGARGASGASEPARVDQAVLRELGAVGPYRQVYFGEDRGARLHPKNLVSRRLYERRPDRERAARMHDKVNHWTSSRAHAPGDSL